METRVWLIRHAIVAENERAQLYGILDVQLCPDSLVAQMPMYRALAARLPRPAIWFCTPLSRTRRTAEAIFAAGYPAQELLVEPGLIEQNLGAFQGLKHAAVPALLTAPAHPFWPLAATETPPNGESVAEMLVRVGLALDRLVERYAGEDVIAVSHGGAIRAAVAHAMSIDADRALHLSVYNLSLTRLERLPEGWRVISVNESPGFEAQTA
ncbi:MAG: histidine phosphatase family protein [Acetobacteraceae bacterium]